MSAAGPNAQSDLRAGGLSWKGLVAGLVAVLTWASYFGLAREGVKAGLHSADFMVLRFGVAGLITLPLIWWRWRAVRAVGIPRSLLLTLLVGPPFIVFATMGYRFAPLAHGAVQPVTVVVLVTAFAALWLGEALSRQRLVGVVCAVVGIVLVALGGRGVVHAAGHATDGPSWVGDLLFMASGVCWTGFTLLLRRWRMDALVATAIVSVISAALVMPPFLLFDTTARLAALPTGMLAAQILMQGVMSGVVAVYAYGIAIRQLGAGGAALFPAMVPMATLLIGVPITHEVPGALQAAGLMLATLGLVASVVRWPALRWFRRAGAVSTRDKARQ